MPTRSNARPLTLQGLAVPRDPGHDLCGGYCLGIGFERACAPNDRGPRVLLRGPRAPQERTEYDDDERSRARCDRRAMDAVRIFHRVRSRQPVVWRPVVVWSE